MKVEWISTKERQPEIGRAIWRYWPDHCNPIDNYPAGITDRMDPDLVTHWAYGELPEKPEPPKPREWRVCAYADGTISQFPTTKPTVSEITVREVLPESKEAQ